MALGAEIFASAQVLHSKRVTALSGVTFLPSLHAFKSHYYLKGPLEDLNLEDEQAE